MESHYAGSLKEKLQICTRGNKWNPQCSQLQTVGWANAWSLQNEEGKYVTKNTLPSFSLGFLSNKSWWCHQQAWWKVSPGHFYCGETLPAEVESHYAGSLKEKLKIRTRGNKWKNILNMLNVNIYFPFPLHNSVILSKSGNIFYRFIFSFICLILPE
jgi:hypothetical protein